MTEQHNLIPMSPGETLRHGRDAHGWSVEDVATRLKCQREIVEALEADEPCGTLAPIYRRGFLKRYASVLGLPASVSAPWLEDKILQPPELKPVFQMSPESRNTDKWVRATSYVLASLMVGTLAWQMTHEAVRLTQKDSTSGITIPESGGQAVAEGTTLADAHVNASIASLESLRPAGSRTGAAGRRAWAALDAPTGEGIPELQAGEHFLELQTSADSWVEIRDRAGVLVEQDLVRGGSARQYQAEGPFRITLGRSSAVELYLDGNPVDLTPFTTDDVTQMLLDPAADSTSVTSD